MGFGQKQMFCQKNIYIILYIYYIYCNCKYLAEMLADFYEQGSVVLWAVLIRQMLTFMKWTEYWQCWYCVALSMVRGILLTTQHEFTVTKWFTHLGRRHILMQCFHRCMTSGLVLKCSQSIGLHSLKIGVTMLVRQIEPNQRLVWGTACDQLSWNPVQLYLRHSQMIYGWLLYEHALELRTHWFIHWLNSALACTEGGMLIIGA